MSKEKISFENMLAGLLLRFGKVNKVDLEIIQNDLCSKYGITMSKFAIDYNGIGRYIVTMGDNYYLVSSEEAKAALEEKQSKEMKDYLDSLNVEDMVLLKINSYGTVPDHLIATIFSEEQERVLSKLEEDLKVIYVWNNDIPCEDYQEVQLTSFGEARVFELEYRQQIEEFKELLISCGYDVNLIPDFLRSQDLSKGIYEILNIDNFLYYCSVYDRAASAPGVSSVSYKRANYSKESGFDKDAKDMINGMLSVWDDGHCIYICHPNHIFVDKYLTKDNHDIRQVNWDQIDFDKMVKVDDYKCFVMPDCNQSFKYVHKRLASQVLKKQEEGKDETSFLAVIEKYRLDGENQYLVRGLIRGDKEGYSLGFNPEYEKVIPKSVWEKSLRFSGSEIPSPYLIKRYPNKKN